MIKNIKRIIMFSRLVFRAIDGKWVNRKYKVTRVSIKDAWEATKISA